jgi:hypothetical protein
MTSEQNKCNKQTTFLNKYIILSWFGRFQCDKQNKQTTFLNKIANCDMQPKLVILKCHMCYEKHPSSWNTCTWKTKKRLNFNIVQLKLAIWNFICMGNTHPSWDSRTKNKYNFFPHVTETWSSERPYVLCMGSTQAQIVPGTKVQWAWCAIIAEPTATQWTLQIPSTSLHII